MRRRLDLAASLITRPALIFLDEPTTGLDPRTRGQMWDTIRDLVADGSHHPADHPVPRRGRRSSPTGSPSSTAAGRSPRAPPPSSRPRSAARASGSSSPRAPTRRTAVALAADLTRDTPILAANRLGFSVTLTDANQAADVLIALRNHRLDIANATVEQPSLDEVFMALTGHPSETPVPEQRSERLMSATITNPTRTTPRPADRTVQASVPVRDVAHADHDAGLARPHQDAPQPRAARRRHRDAACCSP